MICSILGRHNHMKGGIMKLVIIHKMQGHIIHKMPRVLGSPKEVQLL